MKVSIFKELTTDEYLQELEAKAGEYEGLYVDMDNAQERKFVKDKAYDIQQLIKKIDRKRIDESKQYKAKVEAEAALITERLQSANAPFQFLIDQHKAERAKILAEEKAIREAEELAIQIQVDHEDAINLNKLFELEKAERERIAKENHDKLVAEIAEQERVKAEQQAESLKLELAAAKQAAIDNEAKRLAESEQAKIDEAARIEQAKQAAIKLKEKAERDEQDEIAKKMANEKYLTSICTKVKESLIAQSGISEQDAIAVVKAIRSNKVFSTSIKF